MAELATIARPYAEALFKACKDVAGTDLGAAAAWAEKLDEWYSYRKEKGVTGRFAVVIALK